MSSGGSGSARRRGRSARRRGTRCWRSARASVTTGCAVCPYLPPIDLEARRDELIALWHAHEELKKKVEVQLREEQRLQAEILRLEQQLAKKNRQLFGRSSERRKKKTPGASTSAPKAPEKPSGDTPEDASGAGEQAESAEAKRGHGPRSQPHLEERTAVHDLDEADRVCTSCGGELDEWKGQEETSEEIDVEERVFVRKKHVRKKYRCRCGACIETAPGPERLVPGGRYSLDFAITVAHDKYTDHAPLERQARGMRRLGLLIDSQTLWDQLFALSQRLEPVYEAIWQYVLSSPWVGVDETTWRLLGEDKKTKDESGLWYVWIANRQDAAVYMLDPSRAHDAAKKLLRDYKGKVVCDGHGAYTKVTTLLPSLELVHCWVHARREFLECEQGYPEQSRFMLERIAELYVLEASVPAGSEHDTTRLQMRREHASRVLEQIVGWVYQTALTVPPESKLRKAIGYMVRRWVGLTRFVEDPRLPLDNNATERDARIPALGRKNHYGSRSRRGTEVAARMYTLVETALLSGVEPKAYMKFAALRAIRGKPVVLPHEVTAELLIEELGLEREQAERALVLRAQRTASSVSAPAAA